jgi:hypothetical protein
VRVNKSNRSASPACLSLQSMKGFWFLLLAVSGPTAGCDRPVADTSRTASSTTVALPHMEASETPATSSSAKSACPRTGLWALCSVEKRLKESGFVVNAVTAEIPQRPGFSVRPAVYRLGRSHLEVFLYPTQQAASRAVSGLDTLTATPRGSKSVWQMPPTFIRSANLIAVFLTDSPVQGERLTLAITAGPPQP